MLEQGRKTNVNVISHKRNKRFNNVNVSDERYRKAEFLVEKFARNGCKDADGCLYFFVKCFSKLSDDIIWSIFERATTDPDIRYPIKWFIGACRNQMNV